nr:hypothetical protein [uncultured Actinotalea sp.]
MDVPVGVQVAWVVMVVVAVGCFVVAPRLTRRERAKERVQLPARELARQFIPPGWVIEVEYPGPDGAPLRAAVFSARRWGLGATPPFSGWVWVARRDPSDVVLRPHARSFWPGALWVTGSVLLVVVGITAVVAWTVTRLPS